MAQLPRIYVNIPEVQAKLLELEEENSRLRDQLIQYKKLIQDIDNISNGGNVGIKKGIDKSGS
jgi:hypothetical protein